jgi:NhaP-type Na+/H+ or K+/H+ antiporter
VLAFACLLRLDQFRELGWAGAGFVAIALLVVRPLATAFAVLNRSLNLREWLAAAWFGPKGFASIVYGTLMVQRGIPNANAMFDVIAVVTAVSIVAHSSTDLWVVRAFPANDLEGSSDEEAAPNARAPLPESSPARGTSD